MDVMTIRGVSTSTDQCSYFAIVDNMQTNLPMRCDDGKSKDQSKGQLSVPDIQRYHASRAIQTRLGKEEPYTPILEGHRWLLAGASIRPEERGSDDLHNGLLGAPDIHQDDVSGAFATGESRSTAYALILDWNRRLLEEASIHLGNGCSYAPPHRTKKYHNLITFVPSVSLSTPGDNPKPPVLPNTDMIGDWSTCNDDGACGCLLSDEGKKRGDA
jgi:hypothetical protein